MGDKSDVLFDQVSKSKIYPQLQIFTSEMLESQNNI